MDLVITSDNPAPEGAILSVVRASDGVNLRVVRWVCGTDSRGTVTLLPGRAEFIEKYFETIGELLSRRFDVVAMDWRGQGLSERELANPHKGHVDDFSIYGRDLAALTRQILEPFCPKPWFGIAHSMGGAILAAQAHAGLAPFERIILTAPMIDLYGVRLQGGARFLAESLDFLGFGGSFVPGGKPIPSVVKPFAGNFLTSDPIRYARLGAIVKASPNLAIGDPTIGWINAAFRLMQQFADPDFPRQTLTPILVLAAGADRVVATAAVERFASRLKAGKLITIPYSNHEILMERDAIREQFWAAFDAFIPGARDELEILIARTLATDPAPRRRWFMPSKR